MTERRDGHSKLVWDKAAQKMTTVDPHPPLRSARPSGSNADEWHLFLSEYCCDRPNQYSGMTYMAVQIAEAIEAAERRGREPCGECHLQPGERCDICGRTSHV
jgi:hypothetical protein